MSDKKTAVVVLAEGFEEMEALTPVDLLRRAGIRVDMLGLISKEVKGAHGITVHADKLLQEVLLQNTPGQPLPDAIILPGGLPGAKTLSESKSLFELLEQFRTEGSLIAGICAAPGLILEKAGLLDQKYFTGYPGFHSSALERFYRGDQAVVHEGNLITAQGAGVALDFSLAIIEFLLSREEARSLALSICYASFK